MAGIDSNTAVSVEQVEQIVKDVPPLPQDTPVEVDHAARIFSVGMPYYSNLIDNLSQKSLRRLAKALVEYPLNDETKQLLAHADEKHAFELALELMEARSQMIAYVVSQQEKKEIVNGEVS